MTITLPPRKSPIDVYYEQLCTKCNKYNYFMRCNCGNVCNSKAKYYFGAKGFC